MCDQRHNVIQDAGDLGELKESADISIREDSFDARAGAAERRPSLPKFKVKSEITEWLTRNTRTQEALSKLFTSDNESERHVIKGLCWRTPSFVDTRTVHNTVERHFCDRSRSVVGKEHYYSQEENS